jgi:hypothetical protein
VSLLGATPWKLWGVVFFLVLYLVLWCFSAGWSMQIASTVMGAANATAEQQFQARFGIETLGFNTLARVVAVCYVLLVTTFFAVSHSRHHVRLAHASVQWDEEFTLSEAALAANYTDDAGEPQALLTLRADV